MRTFVALIALSLLLIGCSQQADPLSLDEQVEVLDEDLRTVFADQEVLDYPLTLHEAMARGILYNLDHRVAMMESMIAKGEVDLALLEVLPSLEASAQYTARDNEQVVRGESPTTGAQTLPPTVFEDEDRTRASLTAGWNILDAGLAIAQSKSASDNVLVAEERRRKVIHNIIQDVRYAYWRAASAQILSAHIDNLLDKGRDTVLRLEQYYKNQDDNLMLAQQQMRLLEHMNNLNGLKSQLATAKIELASLINLPPRADYVLAVDEEDIFNEASLPDLKLNHEDLELVALMIRPEVREDILMQRVAAREIHETTLSALPGIGGMFGYYTDNNDFFQDTDWTQFSLSITGNLTRLFTLPVRLKQAKNKEKLVEMRRRAIAVAVLSQVNLARQRLKMAEERFGLVRQLASVSRKMRSVVSEKTKLSDADELEMEIQAALNRARLHMAYAEYQNAYGRLLNSIGMDPLPKDLPVSNLDDMSYIIAERTDKISPIIFDKLLAYIKQKGMSTAQENLYSERKTIHVIEESKDKAENNVHIEPAAGEPMQVYND